MYLHHWLCAITQQAIHESVYEVHYKINHIVDLLEKKQEFDITSPEVAESLMILNHSPT